MNYSSNIKRKKMVGIAMPVRTFTQKHPNLKLVQGFESTVASKCKNYHPANEIFGSGKQFGNKNSLRESHLATGAVFGDQVPKNCDIIEYSHCHDYRKQLSKRFVQFGHEAMLEHELIELLLFKVAPKTALRPLALRLLSTFGDLNGIVAASEHRLLKVEGVTFEVYLHLRLAAEVAKRMAQTKIHKKDIISNWGELIEYCRVSMAHRETELFKVFFLDRKNVLLADEEQAVGTVDHVPVYPREVAKRALELNASALILVHNHPSGDPTPSVEDALMTQKISKACDAIGVIVHDHIIIGKGNEFSFRAEGYFDGVKAT
ncbi:DNA repair protein RadC [uncultured Roseovarius sp.]|uniref:RadC family protein n=1 Tax=uncultured Roseovarius sp. TaxID=293344 RepID=UPI002623C5FE|nr:DNA repair protein RadC [uncultured Roseovarius sp.]